MSDNSLDKGKTGFFDQEFSKIPCFRSTFLYSIGSGISVGLAHFMLTSRVKRSCDLAVGTFALVTLAYWGHCRYNYSLQKFNMGKLQMAMQTHVLEEGTEKEMKRS
ncbi:cytochrome c oxidase assembly factor COX20 lethal (3) 87Df isoform X2 [Oratosquilla oratoria]|uniref:cytochrome c oxidase assembly factor COX20 lethal (3) 87Df isoform X2 n=1 Tax=Oratosquilla oratoria TaxID=337810 RepID=UPI003F760F8D